MHEHWVYTKDVEEDSTTDTSESSAEPFDALFTAWIEDQDERRYRTDCESDGDTEEQ